MIDELILKNLSNKFTRELTKGNLEEAKKVIGRLEVLEENHQNDSLGTMIYFTLRGMRTILKDRK